MNPPIGIFYPRREHHLGAHPTEEIGLYKIWNLANKIFIKLDVHLFHPEDITVRALNNCVIVEGNHGTGDHGEHYHLYHQLSRSFQRTFPLPTHAYFDHMTCNISVDGNLTISVPLSEAPFNGDANVGKFCKVGTLHHWGAGFVPHLPSWHESFQLRNECPGVTLDRDQFAVSLDVPKFLPENIKIKSSGDILIIEGSLDDDEDVDAKREGTGGTGSCGKIGVKANFTRQYPLPLNSDKAKIFCEYRQNTGSGVPNLKVVVPRVHSECGGEEMEHAINRIHK